MHRLIWLFFDAPPSVASIESLHSEFPDAGSMYIARCDEHSEQAQMWTRNPTQKMPLARVAMDIERDDIEWQSVIRLAADMNAEAHWCRGPSPIPPALMIGETFPGTLQLCCFERAQGLSDRALEQIWFHEHAPVAVATQNTVGYRQNLVLRSSHDPLDGIVEELFPITAADSLTAFFADGDDEEKMLAHINVLTKSSERVLNLEKSSVIHMTERRLR